MDKYRSPAQQRVLQILVALAGHEVNGLAPGEVAAAVKTSPSNATRGLANLYLAGLAEQIHDSGRWRLTPRIPQIGLAMLDGVSRAQSKVDEVKQRYSRTPY